MHPRFLASIALITLGMPGCGGDVRFSDDGGGARDGMGAPRERLRDACETVCSPTEGCGWTGTESEAACVEGCSSPEHADDCIEPLIAYQTCLVERGCSDDCIDVFPECVLDE